MHIAEIKPLYHVLQIGWISEAFNDKRMQKIRNLFQILHDDEKFHIRYTALLLDETLQAGADGNVLRRAFGVVNVQTAATIRKMTSEYALPALHAPVAAE